jgi:hypothetical protein
MEIKEILIMIGEILYLLLMPPYIINLAKYLPGMPKANEDEVGGALISMGVIVTIYIVCAYNVYCHIAR